MVLWCHIHILRILNYAFREEKNPNKMNPTFIGQMLKDKPGVTVSILSLKNIHELKVLEIVQRLV